MGVDAGQLVHTIGRASRNAESLRARETSAWDVWRHTGSNASIEQVPGVSTLTGIVGLKQTIEQGFHWPDVHATAAGLKGQQRVTIEQAATLLGLGDAPAPQGALAKVGATFGLLTSLEQLISAPFGLIPFPRFPALRILDMDVGLPHLHNHWPNVCPPQPPLPLPSTGPVVPLPILSGASRTLINGMPAARCGDIGLGVWCGGFFPFYEVFLGSSTVWIEGSRAARLLVDITKHCTFSAPRPTDPPMGPMIGVTVAGSADVLIGGVPMPSLTALALGGVLKGAFRGVGRLFRKATAKAYVAKLLKQGVIEIAPGSAPAFRAAVVNDLVKMAGSSAGRRTLKEVRSGIRKLNLGFANGPNKVTIAPPGAQYAQVGDSCGAVHIGAAHPKTGIAGAGTGAGSHVEYNPAAWPNAHSPGTTPDSVLNHELNHAANNAHGRNMAPITSGNPKFDNAWSNWEEHNVTHADNAYRRENGLPPRKDYTHLP